VTRKGAFWVEVRLGQIPENDTKYFLSAELQLLDNVILHLLSRVLIYLFKIYAFQFGRVRENATFFQSTIEQPKSFFHLEDNSKYELKVSVVEKYSLQSGSKQVTTISPNVTFQTEICTLRGK